MKEVYLGKVLSIKKDKGFLNKEVGVIDTVPEMHFFVKDMIVKVGDTVEIIKNKDEMQYLSVRVTN